IAGVSASFGGGQRRRLTTNAPSRRTLTVSCHHAENARRRARSEPSLVAAPNRILRLTRSCPDLRIGKALLTQSLDLIRRYGVHIYQGIESPCGTICAVSASP